MGLIRKMTSVSTLGGVKYTSKREAQTKAAHAQGKLAREEAKLVRGQVKAQAEELAREHVDGVLGGTYPKWRLTTAELMLLRRARKEQAES